MENFIENINIKSIVTCVPKNEESVNESHFSDKQSAKTFIKRTGVESRRISHGKLTAVDLCCKAAESCLEELAWEAADIGVLVFVSQTPDYAVPPSSSVIQAKLKLPSSVMLFDLNIGCTGWLNGLVFLSSLMQSFNLSKALLLNGDTNVLVDGKTNSSYSLIGDAGCATALEIDPGSNKIHFELDNYGELFTSIIAKRSGARYLADQDGGSLSFDTDMNGLKVFDFVSRIVLPKALAFIKRHEIKADYLVSHQASMLVNNFLQSKLGYSKPQTLSSLKNYGNTSSASIPLTICLNNQENALRNKGLLCIAFGVGMASSFAFFKASNALVTKLIDYQDE